MTLIELVIVIVLLSIVMIFVTNFMIFQHKNITIEKGKIDTIERADKVSNYLINNFRMVGYCADPNIGGFGILSNITAFPAIKTDSTGLIYTADMNDNQQLDPADTFAFHYSGDTLYKLINGNLESLASGIDSFKLTYYYNNGTTSKSPNSLTYKDIIGVGFDLYVTQRLSGSKYFTKEYKSIVDFRNRN